MSNTSTSTKRTTHHGLKQALAGVHPGEGLTLAQITSAHNEITGTQSSETQIRTALNDLINTGKAQLIKGPRSENLYAPVPEQTKDQLARLERENHELQRALAILTGAAARVFAQSDPHQKTSDTWRELQTASDGARETLEGITTTAPSKPKTE